MTPDAREQARHIIDTVQAYLDEKPIRVRQKRPRGEWEDINPEEESPSWDWDGFDFEVKPEERKPREIWINIYPGRAQAYLTELESLENCGFSTECGIRFREVLPETETE